MVKKTCKKTCNKKSKICKGGNGILTYGVNDYKVDAQLDNLATTRQMYNDQSVMNTRVLGGGKKYRRKSCKKGGINRRSRRVSKKEIRENIILHSSRVGGEKYIEVPDPKIGSNYFYEKTGSSEYIEGKLINIIVDRSHTQEHNKCYEMDNKTTPAYKLYIKGPAPQSSDNNYIILKKDNIETGEKIETGRKYYYVSNRDDFNNNIYEEKKLYKICCDEKKRKPQFMFDECSYLLIDDEKSKKLIETDTLYEKK